MSTFILSDDWARDTGDDGPATLFRSSGHSELKQSQRLITTELSERHRQVSL